MMTAMRRSSSDLRIRCALAGANPTNPRGRRCALEVSSVQIKEMNALINWTDALTRRDAGSQSAPWCAPVADGVRSVSAVASQAGGCAPSVCWVHTRRMANGLGIS